jgi:hypothetical protein
VLTHVETQRSRRLGAATSSFSKIASYSARARAASEPGSTASAFAWRALAKDSAMLEARKSRRSMQGSWFAAGYIMRDRDRIVLPQFDFERRYCGLLACDAL